MIPSSISQKIEETIKFLEDKGSPIRRRIADIDEVPFDQFEDLQRSLGKRETIIFLSSLNYDTTVFSLFSTKIESLLGTIYLAIPYLVMIASIPLSIITSNYWILTLIPLSFLAAMFSSNFSSLKVLAPVVALGLSIYLVSAESTLVFIPAGYFLAHIAHIKVRSNFANALLNRAMRDEKAFCLLHYLGQVALRSGTK
jgi:uncharacterized membrane protein YphA (DoxX/SURF4 family)